MSGAGNGPAQEAAHFDPDSSIFCDGMNATELQGFRYRFERGASTERTLLLLHGTGRDENDLIPLGRLLDTRANLLSPRGRVLENGYPRFFRRFAEGVLDIEDLKTRTNELVDFINAAAEEHAFDPSHVTGVGYSNGANIAASTLLLHSRVLDGAILFRPMFPFEPADQPTLDNVRVLIASGRSDPLIDARDPERLAQTLRRGGAEVTLLWSPGGHQLGRDEVQSAKEWLNSPPAN
jgi:phospholipase/carboxylesterase